MLERPRSGERAILVHVGLGAEILGEEREEFEELARSAGASCVGSVAARLRAADPRHLIGRGKVEEIGAEVAGSGADLVLVNHPLSPSQERNLERAWQCRVLDRTGLILDIFAQRARSFEGKLQVELAQLRHLRTRLVRGWTHLERQKGGIGLRGPGETQLETDRRLIGQRIRSLQRRLAKVSAQREQGRRTRRKADVPVISLVGYTNAGKSTLFNRLTGADVYSADQLFATLDPTLRRIALPDADPAVLADTVGFIRALPHELIAAFRSTLEETREASLLLHVVDASDDERDVRVEQVNEVLAEIEAQDVPQVQVYNKVDLLGQPPRVDRDADGRVLRVWLSAKTGAGLPELRQALSEGLRRELYCGVLRLDGSNGGLRSRLYELGAVRSERVTDDGGWELEVRIVARALDRLCREAGVAPIGRPCLSGDTFLQSAAGTR